MLIEHDLLDQMIQTVQMEQADEVLSTEDMLVTLQLCETAAL
jgi:hypothetical protein